MFNQRSVTCNDNFESKLNNKSTPKKLQGYNDEKKVSNDVIFSEIQIVKDETNKSFLKYTERLNKLEEDLYNLNLLAETNNKPNTSFNDNLSVIFERLNTLETKIGGLVKLNQDNDFLKNEVNKLSSEIAALKITKVESQNNLERVMSQIRENSNKVEKILNDQMSVFNKMFSENYLRNANLFNQILINQTTSSFVITGSPKEIVKCMEKPSDNEDKPEVVDKPLIIKSSPEVKPKGDSAESETNKSSHNISNIVATVNQNEKQPGVFATLDLSKSNETNVNHGSLFGNIGIQSTSNETTTIFSQTSSNDLSKPSSGLNTNANTSHTITKETNLFPNNSLLTMSKIPQSTLFDNQHESQKSYLEEKSDTLFDRNSENNPSNLFGNKSEPPKTSLFGDKSGSVQTNIFGVKSESSQPGLFGVKPENSATLFGGKSDNSTSLFGGKSDNSTSLFGGKSDNSTSLFGGKSDSSTGLFGITKSSEKSSNLFGNTNSQQEFSFLSAAENSSNPIFGGNSDQTSFSSLSSATNTGFGSASEVSWKAGSKLFGNIYTKTEAHDESAEHNPEEETEEHDPHFQPIIELPPLIQIQKDEESHDVLFRNRCKLYRFIGSEWKERGVGEMKILQTKEEMKGTKQVKLVMRRDQIRKLVCNQRVSKTVPKFAPMPHDKSTCWVGNDFSEGSNTPEKFAIRFASVEILAEFKGIISKVQDDLPSEDNAD